MTYYERIKDYKYYQLVEFDHLVDIRGELVSCHKWDFYFNDLEDFMVKNTQGTIEERFIVYQNKSLLVNGVKDLAHESELKESILYRHLKSAYLDIKLKEILS